MKLEDYIERVKSVEMTGKPIDAYCKLLAITSDYCDDTGDTGLTDLYDEVDRLIVYDEVEDILRNEGWEAVWKYLRTIPKESINDPLYRVKGGCLYPIDWGDVKVVKTLMLGFFHEKIQKTSEKEELTQALHSLVDVIHKVEKLINKEEKASEAD